MSGQRNILYTRYSKKRFAQIYRDFYGDAMLVPSRMTSNKADGNQQKHLPLDQQATLPGPFHFDKFISDSFSFSDRCLP